MYNHVESYANVSFRVHRGLVFETFASEVAILTMPDGATTQDLLNHKLVMKYIAKNAESWYTYTREKRGREVNNGDIRLVVGFDKVTSWGIATFGSNVEKRVCLEFKTNDSDKNHTWNCVGGGRGRVGPPEAEMDGLRTNDASVTESRLKNQTVFVHTLNFNLESQAWDDLTFHKVRSSDRSTNDPGPPSNQPPPSGPSGGQSGSGTRDSIRGNGNYQGAQFGSSVRRVFNYLYDA